MEHNITSERTIAGLASAKAKEKAKLTVIEYIKYLQNEIDTIDDVCKVVGVSKATLYKYLRLEGIKIVT